MYFNKIMLDVVQLAPRPETIIGRNQILNKACSKMDDAIVTLNLACTTGDYAKAKQGMCSLVHHAMLYLHTVDQLATDVSKFEYEDAKFVHKCANLSSIPAGAWRQHIPRWGDSICDTHLPSLIFSVMAWCSVNNWQFNEMWQSYRRTMLENADSLIKSLRNDTECDCQPVIVNHNQLELPL